MDQKIIQQLNPNTQTQSAFSTLHFMLQTLSQTAPRHFYSSEGNLILLLFLASFQLVLAYNQK